MKKLAIILLTLIPIVVKSQNIKGYVYTQKDKSAVAFASIGLLNLPDSTVETGVITLTDGAFTFENIKPGKYFIKVSYLGYKTNGVNVNLKANVKDIIADTIFLEETTQSLSEVTVAAERLQGKEMVDRTVYTIPSAVAKTLSNGYDLLRKIPQVQVDFQNNVTLNGSQNFLIQVDGKQRDKEFLAKLQPEDIETIEIINNPSGKYEGNIDGVINIVLKKEARVGLSGSVSAIYKPLNKPTEILSGNLDYGFEKISFYITAFTFRQKLNILNAGIDYFKSKDSTNITDGSGKLNITSTSVNTGFDYYLNDKNTLSFNINYKPIGQDISSDNFTSLGSHGGYRKLLYGNKTSSDEGSVSLFYKLTFKKPIQELTFENTYYMFNSNNKNHNSDTTFISKSLFTNYLEENINDRNYFSSKLNYVHPFGMNVKTEVGYQFYYQQMNFDFRSDSTNSNIYNYSEIRHSIYGGLTLNLKKFGFQSNLRIENSNNFINNDSLKTKYTCFLPSVNLQYKFTTSQNIKLTYNRRINRPGVYDLNPFRKFNANKTYSEGNSELKPEYRDRYQLTYSLNFGKNYISPYAYYEKISDKVSTRYLALEDSTSLLTRPENIQTGEEYGGGLNAMLWILNVNARIYKGSFFKKTLDNPIQNIESKDYFSYSLNGYFFAQLPKDKKLTEFIFFNYNGVNIEAQTKTYSLVFYGFGAQKELGNHNIGFVYLLPFSKIVDFRRTETITDFYNSKQFQRFDVSGYIQFMYTYKFNKGKSVKKVNRKVDIESDSKTEGISR